jgi:hypothetical protein
MTIIILLPVAQTKPEAAPVLGFIASQAVRKPRPTTGCPDFP